VIELKCGYKYCKNNIIENEDEAIKENGKYYHLSCYEKKVLKADIFDAFCGYVHNNENGLLIKKKIKDYIDIDGYNPSYVYFTLYYIIKNKIPLHSIFGLKFVMNQKKVKDEYEKCLNKYKNVKIQPENIDFVYKKEFNGGWRDLIG
jgi:hypothetical protein